MLSEIRCEAYFRCRASSPQPGAGRYEQLADECKDASTQGGLDADGGVESEVGSPPMDLSCLSPHLTPMGPLGRRTATCG